MEQHASILVVDDEPDLLDNISLALEAESYRVLVAQDGLAALKKLESEPVNLILADIAMPNMNGYQLYERVRENPDWTFIPFIFLTARTLDSDINYGKELGADDYLTKPIRSSELVAVVRGKLRRSQQLTEAMAQAVAPTVAGERLLSVGQLKIDAGQHRVWVNEEEVRLSAREFSLLEHLARQADKIVPPQDLIQVTHELETDHVEAGTLLRPLILALRRKLGSPVGDTGFIENVRGVGYRLIVPHNKSP
jgi:DNA-binding response OmpR family regulator